MKHLLMLILLITILTPATAQKTIIRSGTSFIGNSENPVVIVDLEDFSRKEIEKKWISYLKKNKGKVSEDDDVIFHDNAMIGSISTDTLDMWSTVTESGKTIVVSLAINQSGVFLSNNSAMERFLYDFAIEVKKERAEEEVEEATKQLKSIEKDKESLEKDNKKMADDIVEMRNRISENERDIKKNEEEIRKKEQEVGAQQTVVKQLEQKLKSIE